MLGHKERLKQQQVLTSTSSAISGAIDNLARNIKTLDLEVKNAAEGEFEYQGLIRRLEKRKIELEERIKESSEWIDAFDKNIGPFKDKYDVLVKDIEVLYGEVRPRHPMYDYLKSRQTILFGVHIHSEEDLVKDIRGYCLQPLSV